MNEISLVVVPSLGLVEFLRAARKSSFLLRYDFECFSYETCENLQLLAPSSITPISNLLYTPCKVEFWLSIKRLNNIKTYNFFVSVDTLLSLLLLSFDLVLFLSIGLVLTIGFLGMVGC